MTWDDEARIDDMMDDVKRIGVVLVVSSNLLLNMACLETLGTN
jgi:hypothetical protein